MLGLLFSKNICIFRTQGRKDALRGTTLIDSVFAAETSHFACNGATAAPFPARGTEQKLPGTADSDPHARLAANGGSLKCGQGCLFPLMPGI